MHVEKSSVICQLFGLVSAQQYALSFKMPKSTHQLCAASQGFTDWLSTSTTLGKVLGITEAKVSLVFFYLTGFPSVLQSVSVRILICPVNIILVSLVAKTTFKRWGRKETQLQRLQDTSVFHLNLFVCCSTAIFQSLQSLNQLHHVGLILSKPFEFLRKSPAKPIGTRLALRMPLHWTGARIKVKDLLKCLVVPGAEAEVAAARWVVREKPGKESLNQHCFTQLSSGSWGSKGRKEWCFPKDLVNYRTKAPIYAQDIHRRKT